ncbi:YceD family protein [Paenibacillus xanthanilyticus]|uniref:YceD family protein n=1 Tax=Paenibacillus xanthanilyticus TaxID=1783531 RepID=A0ABV8KC85_9BACL
MEIHVQELATKASRTPLTADLNTDWLQEVRKDVLKSGPIKVALEGYGQAGILHIEGELSLDLEMSCSRCLEPVHETIVVPFHERFKPASAKHGAEDEEIIVVEEDKVDLEPIIEETMLLALPFTPMCKEDCKGLCHSCGANLNESACGCPTERIDPRLAALKDLFKDNK